MSHQVFKSTSDVLRLMKQGAVKVNGVKITDPKYMLDTSAGPYIIQVGKRWVKKFIFAEKEGL